MPTTRQSWVYFDVAWMKRKHILFLRKVLEIYQNVTTYYF